VSAKQAPACAVVIYFFVAAGGGACGSTTASETPGGPPAVGASSEACSRYARAFVACLPPDPILQRYEEHAKDICDARRSAPSTSWTSEQVTACAAAIEAVPCDPTRERDLPRECDPKPGALAEGAECKDSSQCASAICVVTLSVSDGGAGGASCGTCTKSITQGQPCGKIELGQCAKGTVCTGSPATCTVVTYGDAGAACGAAARCNPGLYCATTNTCAARLAEGTPCTSSEACASGLTCADATKTCTKKKTANPGEACDADTSCSGGGRRGCTDGICPRVVLEGEACDANDRGQTCELFTTCSGGTCRLFIDVMCE
jgi:hypothetical protein